MTEHYFTPRPTSGKPAGEKTTGEPTSERKTEKLLTLHSGDRALQFASGAGVFSKSHLDDGSALLIETFLQATTGQRAHLLDLGCGWGAVGCSVAARKPDFQIAMCDINIRAAILAQSNARRNAMTNVAAWCGDGASATRENCFDFVLCNPPVRAGNAVIARLFGDAQRALKSGGELWIVLRTAQGAKSWQRRLQSDWGNCRTRAMHSGFRILSSTK